MRNSEPRQNLPCIFEGSPSEDEPSGKGVMGTPSPMRGTNVPQCGELTFTDYYLQLFGNLRRTMPKVGVGNADYLEPTELCCEASLAKAFNFRLFYRLQTLDKRDYAFLHEKGIPIGQEIHEMTFDPLWEPANPSIPVQKQHHGCGNETS